MTIDNKEFLPVFELEIYKKRYEEFDGLIIGIVFDEHYLPNIAT
jgi:hypothetical protein